MNKNNKILKITISIFGLLLGLFVFINAIKTINNLIQYNGELSFYIVFEIAIQILLFIGLVYYCTYSILSVIKNEYKKTLPFSSLSIFLYILALNLIIMIFYFKTTYAWTFVLFAFGLVGFILNYIYFVKKCSNLFIFLITDIIGFIISILLFIIADNVINYLIASFMLLFFVGLIINTCLLLKNKGE